jgi:hypothetical protein
MPILTDTARLKRYIGIAGSGDDALLGDLMAGFESKAAMILNGRVLALSTYTDVRLDGTGMELLQLPQYPIGAVTQVLETTQYQWSGATPLVEDQDYTVDYPSGVLTRIGSSTLWGMSMRAYQWLPGVRNIKVSFTAGYGTMPDDVIEAGQMCVADMYQRAKQLAGGQGQGELTSESISGARSESYQVEIDPQWGIPKTALATLKRYRLPA